MKICLIHGVPLVKENNETCVNCMRMIHARRFLLVCKGHTKLDSVTGAFVDLYVEQVVRQAFAL